MAALACLTPFASAWALEFGALDNGSYLNQPLDARIPLRALTPEERSSLKVSIASPSMFKRFNIQRSRVDDRLQVSITSAAGSNPVVVHVRTRQPVREPFVDFLLEADTNNGRALREYTILLDPSSTARSGSAGASTVARNAPESVVGRQRRAARPQTPHPRDQSRSAAAESAHSGTYGPVSRGDTLWSIAAQVKPRDLSTRQTMHAIYQANPQAFAGSMNALKQGAMLRLPGDAQTTGTSAEATRTVTVSDGHYGPVLEGDTLWSIAAQVKPRDLSTQRMMRAIYQANPHAFAGGMNTLMRGATLQIPEGPAAGATVPSQAAAPANKAQKPPVARAPANASNSVAKTPDNGPDAVIKGTASSAAGPPGDAAHPEKPKAPHTAAASGAAQAASGQKAAVVNGGGLNRPAGPGPARSAPVQAAEKNADGKASVAVAEARATSRAPESKAGTATVADNPTADLQATSTATAGPGTKASSGSAKPAKPPEVKQGAVAATAAPQPDTRKQPVKGGVRDVAAPDEGGGLLSLSNLLWLPLLAGLAALLVAWWRRRQYAPMPMSMADEDTDPGSAGSPESGVAPKAPSIARAGERPDTAEPARPATAEVVAAADENMRVGEFLAARQGLEAALRQVPRDQALQNKLLEVDYLAGDAQRFSADVERFDADLQASGQRRARIAAMGRVLLPGDERFQADTGETSVVRSMDSGSPVQPRADATAPTRHPDEQRHGIADPLAAEPRQATTDGRSDIRQETAVPDSAEEQTAAASTAASMDIARVEWPAQTPDEDAVRAAPEASATEIWQQDSEDHEWQPSELEAAAPRRHDRSDDPGVDFELDISGDRDITPRSSVPQTEARRGSDRLDHGLEMIDPGAFDLQDGAPAEDGSSGTDTVEVRLELARMYIDMEDEQMARDLLQEVIERGDATQSDTARSLLAKVG